MTQLEANKQASVIVQVKITWTKSLGTRMKSVSTLKSLARRAILSELILGPYIETFFYKTASSFVKSNHKN